MSETTTLHVTLAEVPTDVLVHLEARDLLSAAGASGPVGRATK